MKKDYVAPRVEELGSLPDMTLAGSNGNRLDADFGAGTGRGELTFS